MENLLDSWKAIAHHLGHSIRTCQRLEREAGLPIHRLDGSPKAHVFAYAEELDGWLKKTAHRRGRSRPIRPIILVPLVVLAILAAATYLVLRREPASGTGGSEAFAETSAPFLAEARAAEKAYVTECDPKDLERAIHLYEQAVAASPGDAAARFGLGSCYQNDYLFNGRNEASFAAMASAYREALELAPDLPEAHLGMGWFHLLSGNRDEACAWFQEALRMAPKSPWVNYHIGVFFGHIGLVEKAIVFIGRAIDLGERSTRTFRMRAFYEMLAGEFGAAAADAARLCAMNPTNPKMFSIRALNLAMKGDLEEAGRQLKVAEALDRDDPYVALTNAYFAALRGERDEALGIVNTMREKGSPPSVLVARIYALLGLGEQVVVELRRALEADQRRFHRVAVPYAFLANPRDSVFDQLRSHPGFRAIVAELMAEHDDLLKRYSGF
jgi:tetratricopeptide (TPR) repeat protein